MKNSYLQDKQLITPSTKISWNDFENGSSESEDTAGNWVLHHDNAPAHTVLPIREFLAKINIPTLPHLPYSPDLALCDFYLFPKLKSKLKDDHFWIVTDELMTQKMISVLLRSMEGTLEPLCNFPRVVL
jgi:hypothetical protein